MPENKKIFPQILRAKMPYLHLFLGLFIAVLSFIVLSVANVFAYWMQFGEGESSDEKYHPVAVIIYDLYPLLAGVGICLILINRSYNLKDYSYVKSYSIIIIFIVLLYIFRDFILKWSL